MRKINLVKQNSVICQQKNCHQILSIREQTRNGNIYEQKNCQTSKVTVGTERNRDFFFWFIWAECKAHINKIVEWGKRFWTSMRLINNWYVPFSQFNRYHVMVYHMPFMRRMRFSLSSLSPIRLFLCVCFALFCFVLYISIFYFLYSSK